MQEELERSRVQSSQLEKQLTQQTGLQEELQQSTSRCQQLEDEISDVSEVCRHQLDQIERLRQILNASEVRTLHSQTCALGDGDEGCFRSLPA